MPDGTCSVVGCNQPTRCSKLCPRHYYRKLRTGTPGPVGVIVKQRKKPAPCSIDGCNRPACAYGMCQTHRRRVRDTGDPGPAGRVLPPQSQPRGRTPCSVEGCARPRSSDAGLCLMHYKRLRRTGAPGAAGYQPRQRTAVGVCSVDGCDRDGRYVEQQMCERHYARWKQGGDPIDLDAPWPDPMSPTVEHLECVSWPDSAGDVLANVGASHYTCNCQRLNRPHPAAARKRAELVAQESVDREATA